MTEITGTDLLRKATLAWSSALAQIARDLRIPLDDLDAFKRGKGQLKPDALKALARHYFGGNVEFDPAINRLRSSNKQEPISMGRGPDPYVPPPNAPKFQGGPPPPAPGYCVPTPPKAKVRPGWAE